MSVFKRITKRIKMTADNFKFDISFSPYYALLRIEDELGGRIGFKKTSQKAHLKRQNWITDYLKKELSDIIDKYKSDSTMGEYSENAPIWICWWTGEDSAPDLVKQCIKSIRKNAGAHPVYLINQNNYREFINIPDYITVKLEKKQMKLAHLSDYIRVSLLCKYGGLWLDSTIFCIKQIPKEYFNMPFFTCKSETDVNCSYLSKMRWVTFVLAGWKNNIVYTYLQQALETYWKNNDSAIDYLFFDHLIELGYDNIPSIKQLIDNIPINNLHRDDLQAAMNDALPADEFGNIIQSDTVLYKLSWRETYSSKTADGQESVYAYFLNRKV